VVGELPVIVWTTISTVPVECVGATAEIEVEDITV
jgi:hypothetical protein